ncbi:MAG: hypothetical protein ACXVPX_00620 [Actinomycetota bacterium]|jgi:hypothetical protein
MDKRTAITIAAALVVAMFAGIVAHDFTLKTPPQVRIVVQNPAPAPAAAPHGEGD